MRYRKSEAVLAFLAALLISNYAVPGYAAVLTLTPVVFGSVEDSSPDGIGDTVSTFVPGVIDNVPSPPAAVARVTSAVVEYDVSAFAGMHLKAGTLDGSVFANNFLDTGERIIEILLFAGDGTLSPSDFQIAATGVGTVSYHPRPLPPSDRDVAFSFDVTDFVQSLLDGGDTFVGVRFAALNVQAPSQLSALEPPTLSLVSEPTTLGLLGIGFATFGMLAHRANRTKLP